MFQFKFPDIGEGLVEGEIIKWLVKPGDVVREDQVLCEVMTDKANVEIPSPKTGKILRLLAKEGQVVPVGSVILELDTDVKPGAAAPAAGSAPARKEDAAPVAKPKKDFDDIPLFSPTAPPQRQTSAKAPAAFLPSASLDTLSAKTVAGKALAVPATRRLARELGVKLEALRGTGPAGLITAQDVRSAATQPRNGAAASAAPVLTPARPQGPATENERRVPLQGLRRKIAERMVLSKHTAPHYSFFEEADLTELVRLRAQLKEAAQAKGTNLTFMPFFVKAVVAALKKFPIVNASLDDKTQEIVYKEYYHIGIATATEQGLTVPVVKHCDRLTLPQIGAEIHRVAEDARRGKLSLDDARGSTFTLTNVGVIGGLMSTPILNIPEVGIMGIHEIKKKPWVVNDQIVVRDIMIVSMSFDHRVVDGAVGAQFTKEVIRHLENPALLFLEGHW